jgi:ABC transporter substrate binding protein
MVHRALISTLAARHRLPAVYAFRLFVNDGGLMSFGPDSVDPHRRAVGYVDRILKGEKPADLPVQTPTKYELVVNSGEGARAQPADNANCTRRRGDRVDPTWIMNRKTAFDLVHDQRFLW